MRYFPVQYHLRTLLLICTVASITAATAVWWHSVTQRLAEKRFNFERTQAAFDAGMITHVELCAASVDLFIAERDLAFAPARRAECCRAHLDRLRDIENSLFPICMLGVDENTMNQKRSDLRDFRNQAEQWLEETR